MSISVVTGQIESLIVGGFVGGILTVQIYNHSKILTKKPTSIAVFVQLILCWLRNVTVLIHTGSPSIDCYWISIWGLTIYHIWLIALQFVLYTRSLAFVANQTQKYILQAVTFSFWIAILGVRIFQKANLVVTSKPDEFCKYRFTGPSMSLANVWLLIGATSIHLVPFLYRGYEAYKNEDTLYKGRWLRLSVVNGICTSYIIFIELFARYVPPMIPNFSPWFGTLFTLVNFTESNVVIFMLEDTKSEFTGKQSKISTTLKSITSFK
jgi:hypothetical protein